MELKGKIHLIGETEEIGNNGFTKRLVVIATDEQYVQYIPIDFIKDKTSLLDNFSIGAGVKISVNVRGNEYNGKYYVNLNGWRIESDGTVQETPPVPPADAFEPIGDLSGADMDLPF